MLYYVQSTAQSSFNKITGEVGVLTSDAQRINKKYGYYLYKFKIVQFSHIGIEEQPVSMYEWYLQVHTIEFLGNLSSSLMDVIFQVGNF